MPELSLAGPKAEFSFYRLALFSRSVASMVQDLYSSKYGDEKISDKSSLCLDCWITWKLQIWLHTPVLQEISHLQKIPNMSSVLVLGVLCCRSCPVILMAALSVTHHLSWHQGFCVKGFYVFSLLLTNCHVLLTSLPPFLSAFPMGGFTLFDFAVSGKALLGNPVRNRIQLTSIMRHILIFLDIPYQG